MHIHCLHHWDDPAQTFFCWVSALLLLPHGNGWTGAEEGNPHSAPSFVFRTLSRHFFSPQVTWKLTFSFSILEATLNFISLEHPAMAQTGRSMTTGLRQHNYSMNTFLWTKKTLLLPGPEMLKKWVSSITQWRTKLMEKLNPRFRVCKGPYQQKRGHKPTRNAACRHSSHKATTRNWNFPFQVPQTYFNLLPDSLLVDLSFLKEVALMKTPKIGR